jgi:hypothetical protein
MLGDKYIVMKLATGEEVVCHMIHEDDYEIKVLFPMIVKHVQRIGPLGRAFEQIMLSPYTYFAADDEYIFHKHQIVFIKDLDPKYETEYNRAIDDFIGMNTEAPPPPYNPEEIQQLTEKLQNMFRRDEFEEELPEAMMIPDTPKTIH